MQPTIMFHIGTKPASGVKLSCMAFTAPQEVPVVAVAKSTLFITPKRVSLPSINWLVPRTGFVWLSDHQARENPPTSRASITAKMHQAWRRSPIITPKA